MAYTDDVRQWAEDHGEIAMTRAQFEEGERLAAAEPPTDEELYLEIITWGEPYDLDQCVVCGSKTIADCWCTDASRCLTCSVHADLEDSGLCAECDQRVEQMHKEGVLP